MKNTSFRFYQGFPYFLFGFILAFTIQLTMFAQYPEPQPEGDITCGNCGAYDWYFKLAVNDEEDE